MNTKKILLGVLDCAFDADDPQALTPRSIAAANAQRAKWFFM